MAHEANGGISGHKQHTAWDPSDRMTPGTMPDLSTQKTPSKKHSIEPYSASSASCASSKARKHALRFEPARSQCEPGVDPNYASLAEQSIGPELRYM